MFHKKIFLCSKIYFIHYYLREKKKIYVLVNLDPETNILI